MRTIVNWVIAAIIVIGFSIVGTWDKADAAVSTIGASQAPPCQYEDGSGQRSCVWDAKHMGNGEGQSFFMHRQGFRKVWEPVSHRQAHRMVKRWRIDNCAPMDVSDDGYPYAQCTGWKG